MLALAYWPSWPLVCAAAAACAALYLYRWATGALYVFDKDSLQEIVNRHLGKPYPQIFEDIAADIAETWPGHATADVEWLWCNSGGCMWSFNIMHSSLSEYLIFTGSGVPTSGHTGRHLVDIHDIVVGGSALYCDEDTPWSQERFSEGDSYHLRPLESQSLAIDDHLWLLEYGRGPIATLLPFGLADSIFSTLDWVTVLRMLSSYVSWLAQYLMRYPFLLLAPSSSSSSGSGSSSPAPAPRGRSRARASSTPAQSRSPSRGRSPSAGRSPSPTPTPRRSARRRR